MPPSRHANPFATCWTRPDAMTFQFGDDQSAQSLVEKLALQRWWGAIIGPHGSGKSNLLETLKPRLRAVGSIVHTMTLQNGQRRLPRGLLSLIQPQTHVGAAIVIVDGYEQLGWLERMRLAHRCRRTKCGLLITAHRPTPIPLLIRLAPDERLVQRVVAKLIGQASTRVTPADVAASHACHGSNVREILFDLYDRHESLRHSQHLLNDTACALSRP